MTLSCAVVQTRETRTSEMREREDEGNTDYEVLAWSIIIVKLGTEWRRCGLPKKDAPWTKVGTAHS